MYSKTQATIKVNNLLYDIIKDKCGTNQGGPLSPNLFRFMLADLSDFLKKKHGIVIGDRIFVHLLWADDLVLMSDSAAGLQEQLDGLFVFCSNYQRIVNELKTKIMIFGKSDPKHFIFNKKKLEEVLEYKYLGVVFNRTDNSRGNVFKNIINYTAEKGRKACFATTRKSLAAGRLTPKIAIQLFDSYVTPVLNYATEIWLKPKPIDKIEKVQLKYLKFILGVKQGTCSDAIYGETGRFPLYLNQIIKMIKYWIRIIKMQDSKLVKIAYLTLLDLDSSGFSNWVSKVRNILTNNNFSNIWEDTELLINNSDSFLLSFKEVIYSNYITKWKNNITLYPKLRTFITFKTEFKLENYLTTVRDYKLRKCLSTFRLSSHKLEIERGRYDGTPVDERICKLCSTNTIEDENHFLTQCNFYNVIRGSFFSKDACNLVELLTCNEQTVIFKLAKCLSKMFDKRNSALACDNV